MKRVAVAILTVTLLAGCPGALSADADVPSDQIPMYGSAQKPESLKQAHERFIRETAAAYGSREAASDAFAKKGWQRYEQDDLTAAMRSFNEAWLLNPNGAQPYWGFGAILHDQGKVHEALALLSRAFELDPSNPRLMADLASVVGQEATHARTAAARERFFTKACELFERASALDPMNGHSYGLWALALYNGGRYAAAWEKVHEAQELRAEIPEKFLQMLREKMSEPKRPW